MRDDDVWGTVTDECVCVWGCVGVSAGVGCLAFQFVGQRHSGVVHLIERLLGLLLGQLERQRMRLDVPGAEVG